MLYCTYENKKASFLFVLNNPNAFHCLLTVIFAKETKNEKSRKMRENNDRKARASRLHS